MGREVESVYALSLSVQQLERQPLDEVLETERGVVFVAHAQPPRVGTRVQLDLTTPGESEAVRLQALVTWSRPAARPGILAGFRAQLQNVPSELMTHIRDLALAARAKIENRASELKKSSLDAPVQERIRLREVTSPVQREGRATTGPIPVTGPIPIARPPSTAPNPITGPIPVTGRVPIAPPRPPAEMATSPALPREPALPRSASFTAVEPPPPPRATQSVRVTFSSPRNYLLHYEQFLAHGAVYVTTAPPPPIGAGVAVTLDVPDGEPPLILQAVVERYAQPPEVPQRGWIARFADSDEAIIERLAVATFISGTPSIPGPSRH